MSIELHRPWNLMYLVLDIAANYIFHLLLTIDASRLFHIIIQ